ncbi:hypothetical protein [Gloeothece verrucosa]|uniref:Uncharacterized protein n=1 Tax=Gloeothece verrucosa (strain PCC 7822) TaxID=497965 RepID=E0UHQ9_GLOV7|nr:hypothetical protein [Gloeothece verrucosa]ADN13316.1 hypothetical protein Cyan7822_1315 [Gloeothece verrucosa PCC 7822]
MLQPLPIPPDTELDFSGSHWQLSYSQTFNADPDALNPSRYTPMEEKWLGSFSSPVLLVRVTTTNQNSRYAGKLKQFYDSGPTGYAYATSRRLWLGTQIIRYPQDVGNSFYLSLLPDQWKSSLSILIYSYVN